MRAEQLAGLLVEDHLHHALVSTLRDGLAVAGTHAAERDRHQPAAARGVAPPLQTRVPDPDSFGAFICGLFIS